MNGKRERLLIDAIVETICRCSEDRDNAVQLEVIKVSRLVGSLYSSDLSYFIAKSNTANQRYVLVSNRPCCQSRLR